MTRPVWTLLDPRMTQDHLGYLPGFLSVEDPRKAREQLDSAYISGWNPFDGFTFEPKARTLKYPGDPIMRPLAETSLREEVILFYPSAWVLILQPNGSFEVARLD